jgi:glycine/D-amino acid oxidase-like deaminating enzyme
MSLPPKEPKRYSLLQSLRSSNLISPSQDQPSASNTTPPAPLIKPFNLSLHTHTPVAAVSLSLGANASRRFTIEAGRRGVIKADYVVHATNGYASSLLPEYSGRFGIVPTRGQLIATRANVLGHELWKSAFGANQGYEYWFRRPVRDECNERPLVILGGGRETPGTGFETNNDDDTTVNPLISKTLKDFLPAVFPSKFVSDARPEMEWVSLTSK